MQIDFIRHEPYTLSWVKTKNERFAPKMADGLKLWIHFL